MACWPSEAGLLVKIAVRREALLIRVEVRDLCRWLLTLQQHGS